MRDRNVLDLQPWRSTSRPGQVFSMVAEVHCVAENGGKKIRARIVAHINEEGLRQAGVYDNSYNCQFPRAIRAEGKPKRL